MATLNIGKKIVYTRIPAANVTNNSAYQTYYQNTSQSAVLQVHQFSYSPVSGPSLNVQIELYDILTGVTLRTLGNIANGFVDLPLGAVGTDEAFRGHFLIYPNTGIRYRNINNNAATNRFGDMILLGEENTQ